MKTYDKEFKINAVKVYKSSGRSIKKVAGELGIAPSTFNHWIQDYTKDGDKSFPGKGQVTSSEEELRALRRELLHIRQERDILKKAVAIFSGPQGKGINS